MTEGLEKYLKGVHGQIWKQVENNTKKRKKEKYQMQDDTIQKEENLVLAHSNMWMF